MTFKIIRYLIGGVGYQSWFWVKLQFLFNCNKTILVHDEFSNSINFHLLYIIFIVIGAVLKSSHTAKLWTSFDHPKERRKSRVLNICYSSGSSFGRWFRYNELLQDIVRVEFLKRSFTTGHHKVVLWLFYRFII